MLGTVKYHHLVLVVFFRVSKARKKVKLNLDFNGGVYDYLKGSTFKFREIQNMIAFMTLRWDEKERDHDKLNMLWDIVELDREKGE